MLLRVAFHAGLILEYSVKLSGVVGKPPPPTTKLAIFYRGGYESQILLNATGYGTDKKWELYERQIKFGLKQAGYLDKFDVLEFQVYVGCPPCSPGHLNML